MAEQKLVQLILDSRKPSQIGISLGPFYCLDRGKKSVWVFVKGLVKQIRGFCCLPENQVYFIKHKALISRESISLNKVITKTDCLLSHLTA